MKYRLREVARKDLREIARYMSRDDRAGAVAYVSGLLDRIEAVAANPLHYAVREEWGVDVRMAISRSHRILFRIEQDCVQVLRVYHSARDFGEVD